MGVRRTKGEGSIFQRADGLWVGRIDLGATGGKRVRRQVTARSLRELRPKFKALRDEVEQGVLGDDTTVEKWLRYWLEKVAPGEVKPRTLNGYRGYAETWLIPELGRLRLRAVRPEHIRALHEHMAAAGKSTATIRQAHMVLRVALKFAVYERKIGSNPAERVRSPKPGDGSHGVLSRDEARSLIDLLDEYGRDGLWDVSSRFLVALLVGLRQGEALGLRWDDIDWTPGGEAIRLTRQVQRRKGEGLVVAPLKTSQRLGDGRRVPLLPVVVHALAEHRRTAPDGYVWGGEKPTDPRRDWGVWKGVLWSAGAGDHPLHAARATTASILSEAKVPLKTIAEILGHSQITTAWTHYVHSDDRQQREGLEAGWKALGTGAAS